MDLHGHYRYIAYGNFDAAERLLAAFEDAVEKLADMPGMGPALLLKIHASRV